MRNEPLFHWRTGQVVGRLALITSGVGIATFFECRKPRELPLTCSDLRSALFSTFGEHDPTVEALTLPELERLALVYAKQLRERSAPAHA